MCTKILLEQLERLKWDGEKLQSQDWRMTFKVSPWTKGLQTVLRLQALQPFPNPEKAPFKAEMTIVLRRGQESKLVRSMLRLWASRVASSDKTSWLDKKVNRETRIGPSVQCFVQAVMARYVCASDLIRDRALADLRRSVAAAQKAGLTEHDLKMVWDEGLFAEMLSS